MILKKIEVIVASIKVRKEYDTVLGCFPFYAYAKLYKSKKGRYLLSYKLDGEYKYELLSEETVKKLLISSDIDAYEKQFGEIEEG